MLIRLCQCVSTYDSIFISHEIDLFLLDKTNLFKNFEISQQLLWKRWRQKSKLPRLYEQFLNPSVPPSNTYKNSFFAFQVKLILQTKWHALQSNFYHKITWTIFFHTVSQKKKKKRKKKKNKKTWPLTLKTLPFESLVIKKKGIRCGSPIKSDTGMGSGHKTQCHVYIRCNGWAQVKLK